MRENLFLFLFQNIHGEYLERGDYYLDPFQTSLVNYEPSFIPSNQTALFFSQFMGLNFTKAHHTRSVIWFGPVDYFYGSVNLRKCPIESNDTIYNLSEKLSNYLHANFNSCLVNLYMDESQMVPKHSDDEAIFGNDPVIASLSFGAARKFIIEPKNDEKSRKRYYETQYLKSIKSRFTFCLSDGDLLVMRGAMQRYWNHSVPPETTSCGPRINLTFRNVIRI